uniref:DNA-directed RNA polymerase n=1 Tax=Strongyloides venezuelensis TaxID=75913 RepID=A0A0K0FGV6_STRVS
MFHEENFQNILKTIIYKLCKGTFIIIKLILDWCFNEELFTLKDRQNYKARIDCLYVAVHGSSITRNLILVTELLSNTLKPAIEYVASNMFFGGSRNQAVTISEYIDKVIKKKLIQKHVISITSLNARLYVPRKLGGRGLVKFEDIFGK